MLNKKEAYDIKYKEENYFHYREWVYAPYISSLVSYCHLKPGSLVLDVGCGQGLFSHLFRECGMRVHGIDMSEIGIRTATARYAKPGITFEATDVNTAVFPDKFDGIFVRSCSLYNTDNFPQKDEVTAHLLTCLKPGGVLIFVYYTNLSGKTSPDWRYHSLRDIAEHFRKYSDTKIFFCNKIDTLVMRKWALNSAVTRINVLLSRICGIGGDAICVLSSGRNHSR
jgi:SAM-dependent methyltransferase